MKIGQVARLAEVSAKAIRRYEALGLVAPARQANGYREYDDDAVRLVREIRALNRLGIPVEETRPFLDCLASGGEHVDDCPSSLAEYRRAIAELGSQIDALTARRDRLIQRLHMAAHRNSVVPEGRELISLPPDLPVPADDGAADHLVGLAVPALTFDGTDGGVVDLAGLGSGRTIVYLYPLTGRPDVDLPDGWDSIPGARGCTAEACGFRDHHAELQIAGAERVFGLSSQSTGYQREVVERLGLPFVMLSDPGLRLAEALSLPTFEAGGQRLYRRLTLVLRGGVIEHVFYPVFPPDQHAEQVLAWLRG
ncbi:MerR family transcriptional regulator [Nocardia yunnanensis]|uniref:MerR family transcriptional regulator n=1 Tax=Nocardia yunnanensis TaxID=2382165 RepID=A0A386Z888_9NOCA|nr:MerR family transcriptional regulator [Nocardia yunnanensis]AYF73838.1 MerR family transcriptional regulator [Nocardia yunnanensis]